jgi:hypothetical protein
MFYVALGTWDILGVYEHQALFPQWAACLIFISSFIIWVSTRWPGSNLSYSMAVILSSSLRHSLRLGAP